MTIASRALCSGLITALAVLHCAAQSCSGTITVTQAPSGCATWSGDIVVPTGAQDDVVLDGLEEIQGNLRVSNADRLSSLASDSLHTVTDRLLLETVLILNTIDFPELTVIGDLEMTGLPNMQENSLLRTLTNLTSLSVVNTALAELEGFSLETLDRIVIRNNNYLQRINLQPYNITGLMSIEANGQDLEVSMPNVQVAQNLTFANCSSISTPSLRRCFGLGVYSNSISEFNGAPLLREVDTSLAFVNNAEMTRIALPELTTVAGGFEVSNNSRLEALDELYSLERVDGAVDLRGPLENVTFRGLQEVTGTLSINSTLDIPCDRFDQYYVDGLVADYRCTTASDTSDASTLSRASTDGTATPADNSNSGSGSGTSNDEQSQSLSTGARVGIGIGVGGGVGALVGGLVGFWFHRRAKTRKAAASEGTVLEKDGSEVDRANMLDNDRQKFEMEQPMGEMGTGAEAQELPAKHGVMELDRSTSTKGPAGIESRHEMPTDEHLIEKDRKTEY